MWQTKICKMLGIQYPILEGGMTMAGNAELAAAVSEAGGIGMLGANPGWVPVDKRLDNLRSQIKKTKGLTRKPFGVNITMFAMEKLAEALIDVALDEGVKVIVTSGGNPRLYTKKIKDKGAVCMHVIGNVKMAKGAEDAGVDAIIAEGYEAGGVNFPDELTTFVLVPYIVDAVKVPVVAAGGVADARSFVAALALGAEGVQIGTRFLVTHECHVARSYKEAIIAAGDTDTLITQRALGACVRSLKNPYSLKVLDMDRKGDTEGLKQYVGLGKAREGQILGDAIEGDMNVGQVAGRIKEIVHAADIVKEIIGGADAVLDRCLKLRGNSKA